MKDESHIEEKCGECGSVAKLNVYHNQGKLMFEIACEKGCYSTGFKDDFNDAHEKWRRLFEYLKNNKPR